MSEPILTKEEKYDNIIEARKVSIEKYQKSPKGKIATTRASKTYYERHREKILAKKKAEYVRIKAIKAKMSIKSKK